MTLTDQIIELSAWSSDDMPARAREMARFSLLDWMVCGRAGINEPLAQKLRALAGAEAGAEVASVFGGGAVPARMAALVNGATSHALDYDDTHFAHVGHLSVGIYPAALAVAEEMDASAAQVTEAFLVGAEAAIRIGMTLGRGHYDLGFHQTATAGAFGAVVSAGRLYGLDAVQMRAAIGLCATRASGLKSQFGTMGKPYNAGIAAANGVECAALARFGFTSADDGLLGPQGFVETHAASGQGGAAGPLGDFLFEDNKYKLHACCHGLHAMIEALQEAVAQGKGLGDVARLELRTSPRWLKVCNIQAPRSGLEVKFSYKWLAGMVLRGDATGDDRVYTDALAGDAELQRFADRVTVLGDEDVSDLQIAGALKMTDGRKVALSHDLAAPLPLGDLSRKLRRKAAAVLPAAGEALWDLSADLDTLDARALGAAVRSGPRV